MASSTAALSLGMVPQEVLEHIAFFAATDGFLGPPAGIVPLLTLNRAMHDALSCKTNPHLYARIFSEKYDEQAAVRRLGVERLPATALAEELRTRSSVLSRIRARLDSRAPACDKQLGSVLWTAYLMALESDGKNERQLLEYAHINDWLKEYLFDPDGASDIMNTINVCNKWAANSEHLSLSLWLFWYMLQPEEYLKNDPLFRNASGILKVIALGAHEYPSCYPDWVDFVPHSCLHPPTTLKHFSSDVPLVAPAPATPAILAYLTLVNQISISWDTSSYSKPLLPPLDVDRRTIRKSMERDCDWARLRALADPKVLLNPRLTGAFTPGSLEGVWEGIFTYTEFTSYAALLSGAPPSVLQKSLVAQHRQFIKIREWHFLSPRDDEHGPSDGTHPLGPGNPSRGYIPDTIDVHEYSERLRLVVPGQRSVVYHSWASVQKMGAADRVVDVFLTGEGHSAWGQFNLLGRIRPSDGYISLSKEYTDGDRGKWLYRAYMVGNANGNLAGRWRDTLSPARTAGYEGTWVASRRR